MHLTWYENGDEKQENRKKTHSIGAGASNNDIELITHITIPFPVTRKKTSNRLSMNMSPLCPEFPKSGPDPASLMYAC